MDGLGLAEFDQGHDGDVRVGGFGRLLVEPQCGRPVVQDRFVQRGQVDPRVFVSQVDGAFKSVPGRCGSSHHRRLPASASAWLSPD